MTYPLTSSAPTVGVNNFYLLTQNLGKHSGSSKATITQYVHAILEQIPKQD